MLLLFLWKKEREKQSKAIYIYPSKCWHLEFVFSFVVWIVWEKFGTFEKEQSCSCSLCYYCTFRWFNDHERSIFFPSKKRHGSKLFHRPFYRVGSSRRWMNFFTLLIKRALQNSSTPGQFSKTCSCCEESDRKKVLQWKPRGKFKKSNTRCPQTKFFNRFCKKYCTYYCSPKRNYTQPTVRKKIHAPGSWPIHPVCPINE